MAEFTLKLPLSTNENDPGSIEDADGVKIAECWHDTDLNANEAVLVSDEIVRRVNIHSELVTALRSLLANYESVVKSEWSGTSSYRTMMAEANTARAVLAKVETR